MRWGRGNGGERERINGGERKRGDVEEGGEGGDLRVFKKALNVQLILLLPVLEIISFKIMWTGHESLEEIMLKVLSHL
ncbi:hypothetical protein L2E82_06165 [Cichorium intybus]|uniref:Uncharacterized protein n=1 Tax=Cichorium intybus TaxID=13427 RepID=A0ACB9HAS9_CICIN|nr:hypothetical protein L2E82_06165 [Cichorium intybus]